LPNPGKAEHIRYAQYWYRLYVLDYCAKYYDQGPVKKPVAESTAGLGWIANQAQQCARGIINAGFAAEKATDTPFHCPADFPFLCEGSIEADKKGTSYAYWVKPPTCPKVPAQTHRALNNALRRGGMVARVFVEFPKLPAVPSPDVIACDVGVNIGVARSDGYKSKSLHPAMNRARQKRAAQQRQGHQKSSTRSAVKQLLDREARKVVTFLFRLWVEWENHERVPSD
jgi:hypothetical protein